MIQTLRFGAPVYNGAHHVGKLERIIVNNGIANQITVDPGLLRTERVVPINVFQTTENDELRLDVSDDEWRAYSAYKMQHELSNPSEDQPNLAVLSPSPTIVSSGTDTDHPSRPTGAYEADTTVADTSVVLTASTQVVHEGGAAHRLQGLVIDTGRPRTLLLDDGSTVPFDAVTRLDENHIRVGGHPQQPILDADRGYEATRPHDPHGDERR